MAENIADGYTIPFYIAGVDRLYPALRGKMRRILQTQRVVVFSEIQKQADPVKKERFAAAAVAKQVIEWDRRDRNGCDIPCTADTVLNELEPALNERLFTVVMGVAPPDEDPLAGEPADTSTEEADVKN